MFILILMISLYARWDTYLLFDKGSKFAHVLPYDLMAGASVCQIRQNYYKCTLVKSR